MQSLTAILNDPKQASDGFQPLPLAIPPLPWTDRDLCLPSLIQQLSALSPSLSRFHSNHASLSPLGLPRSPSPLSASTEAAQAAEQLRLCLRTIPQRFFAAEFDDIEEAASFTSRRTEEGGEEEEEGEGQVGGAEGVGELPHAPLQVDEEEEKVEGGEVSGSGRLPLPAVVLPLSPPISRGVSQYDPKTLMYSRSPPPPAPAKAAAASAAKEAAASTAPPGRAPPSAAPSAPRSFLSYLTAALTGGSLPTFTVPPLAAASSSSFLSSRRFASLSLSPHEERRAAALLSSLSSYLDTLELTLTGQIQLRSASFFSSLLTIHSLHSDAAAVVQQIDSIRAQLRLTSQRLTRSSLSTLCTLQRRSRLLLALSHAEEMSMASHRVQRCRSLVEQARWMAALTVVHEVRVQLVGERMRGLKAAEGMLRDLQRLVGQVEVGLRRELLELLLEAVDDRAEADGAADVGLMLGELKEEEQERLFELLQCLYHVQGLLPFLAVYGEQLLRRLQERTRQQLHGLTAASQSQQPQPPPSPAVAAPSSSPTPAPLVELPTSSPPSASSSPSTSTSGSPVSTPHPTHAPRSFQQALSAMLPTARLAASSPQASPRLLSSLLPDAAPAVPPVAQPATSTALSSEPSTSALARHLSSLSPSAYIDVLRSLFAFWLAALARVVSLRAVLLQAVASIPAQLFLSHAQLAPHFLHDTPPASLEADTAAAADSVSSLLRTAVDWAHSECSRIVTLRPPEAQLPFLAVLLSQLSTFIADTASLIGVRPSPLRAAMAAQASSFLSSFHASQLAALMERLSREQWSRVDVPREFQSMIDSQYEKRITAADPVEQHTPLPPAAPNLAGGAGTIEVPAVKAESIVGARVFFVESGGVAGGASAVFDKFPVVSAVLSLLQAVSAYLDLASQLPSCAAEVSERLLQLLAAFNAKVHALILGAAALKAAGLKTITTTHLALCAQSIGFVLTQLPAMGARLTTPPHSSTCPSLPQLQAEYAQHQTQLLSKLEGIMHDLAEAAFRKLAAALRVEAVAQPTAATAGEAEPDAALRTLLTQTRSLNSSLSHILSQEQRRLLFTRISASYCQLLTAALGKAVDLGRDTARSRAASAAGWMLTQFHLLPGQDKQASAALAQLLHIPAHAQPTDLQETGKLDSTQARAEGGGGGGEGGGGGVVSSTTVADSSALSVASPAASATHPLAVDGGVGPQRVAAASPPPASSSLPPLPLLAAPSDRASSESQVASAAQVGDAKADAAVAHTQTAQGEEDGI